MTDWLIQESEPLSSNDARELASGSFGFERAEDESPIAVSLHDVTIHNTKVWFNRPAEIRIDALFVSPTSEKHVYYPSTFDFAGGL